MRKIKEHFQKLKLNQKFTITITLLVLLPIIGLSSWLFYSMEKSVVAEKINGMIYKQGKSYDQIIKNVESINMSTQFFLSDYGLKEFLMANKRGDALTTQELIAFYNNNIAALERMINNNPYLYQIRVYAQGELVQEMVPIIYNETRMDKLSWSKDVNQEGWKFDYVPDLFEQVSDEWSKKIMSLITPIEDFREGNLGILEVAMTMDTMFPALFDSSTEERSCFVDSAGEIYWGTDAQKGEEQIVKEILDANKMTELARSYELITKDAHYVIGYHPIKELNGVLIGVQNISSDLGIIYTQRNWFILVSIVILFLLTLGINRTVKGILRQFYNILSSIREIQKGDLTIVIPDCKTDEMGELGTQINKMMERILKLMEDNLNHERLVKNTEIRALQNQINAHFIYNVLESIKMMAEIQEEYEISDSITSLGKLLRYSMRWTGANVTVNEELEYIKDYIKLINLRFDYEIYLSLNIPKEVLTQQIPKMSLQPIVENAIYHGIEQMAEDTNIYVKGMIEGDDCLIEITDAGKGMTEEEVEKLYKKLSGEIETSGGSGNGIGLKNVQDRIKMCFGNKYGIEINSKLDCYTKIMVRIPFLH